MPALVLAACQPVPASVTTPTPLPTTTLIQAQVTPALMGLAPILNECAHQVDGVGIVLHERPAAELDLKSSALALRWGPPENLPGQAYTLGQEELVLVAHPQNPLDSLTSAQIKSIYSGAVRTWGAFLQPKCKNCPPDSQEKPLRDQEIHAWDYSPGEDPEEIFEAALGQIVKPGSTFLAPDVEAMRKAVAGDPAAVGFLPARLVDNSLKKLEWTKGRDDLLRQPILAISNSEPQGLTRQWLGCVQEKLK